MRSIDMPLFAVCSALVLSLLTGCTPHPATGNWTNAGAQAPEFTRLDVTFEGRALLYAPGEQEAGRHCFWSGESKNVVRMACTPAFNTSLEERYRLEIGTDGSATLLQDDKVISRFQRTQQ